MKRISALAVVLPRWVFPLVWFGVAGAVSLMVLLTELRQVAVPVLAVTALMLSIALGLRHAWSDRVDLVLDAGDHLVVRKGDVEDRIDLSDIIEVEQTRMMNPTRITLRLRRPCRLGAEVVFSPISDAFHGPLGRYPIALDLA